MENASKALIIAGGIFIALLVTSTLVLGWNKITSYQRAQEESQKTEQITKFNKEFESYNKRLVRGYELVSLYNLTVDTNKKYSGVQGYKEVEVTVTFLGNSGALNAFGGSNRDRDKLTSGIDLIDFMENDFKYDNKDVASEGDDLYDRRKIFKESYFECDDTEYDGENGESTRSGRIVKLHFTQITRNDET